MPKTLLSIVSLILTLVSALAADSAQSAHTFKKEITRTVALRYLLYLPENLETNKKDTWPLLLFLHGAGERGDDLDLVKKHGPPKLIEAGKPFPFIVASPQCPADTFWDPETLFALIEDLEKKHRIDPGRIYVTGLSMGGFGTWALAGKYPDKFAAAAPVCGGGSWMSARALKNLPLWVFHGAKDSVVPLSESERMIKAVEMRGNKQVKFTVYPEANHDSWTETYDNPELYTWFLSHTRARETP